MRAKTLRNALQALAVLSVATMWWSNILQVDLAREDMSEKISPSPNNNKLPRPRFFLHIGPHKSATTTIQCALHANSEVLRQDGIVFLGKIDGGFCGEKTTRYDRIRKIDECIQDSNGCWKNLISEWEDYRLQGMDLMLSKESLSDWTSDEYSPTWDDKRRSMFWNKLAKALEPWNVTILITYRHYYQWLPSAYAQHSYHMIQLNQPWPDSPARTLADFLEAVLTGQEFPPYPFVDSILRQKDAIFPSTWNLQILNLHEDGRDIVGTLLCDVLHAKRTCNHSVPVGNKRTSPSEAIVYDQLNVLASQYGWLRGGKRFARMKQTRRFVQDTLRKKEVVAEVCPSKDLLTKFLKKSLSLQRQLVGNDTTVTMKHVQGFWNATQTFCSVNASQVLAEDSGVWKNFFRH